MIEIRNSTKMYGAKIAVNQISFTVSQGEVFGFLGPNGAGKTTTIRMLIGLLKPTAGEIYIDNLNVITQTKQVQKKIGVVFELPNLYNRATIYNNLKFFGDLYEVSHSRVLKVMESLHLYDKKDTILFAQVMVSIMLTGPNLLEERTNKTIDALLITPLSYKKVLVGKGVTVLILVLALGGLLFISIGNVIGMLMNSPRNGTAVSSILIVSFFLLGTIYKAYPKWNDLFTLFPSIQIVETIQSILNGSGILGLETLLLLVWIVVFIIFVSLKARY